MNKQNQSPRDNLHGGTGALISRRAAVGASGLTVLGLLAGSALGQDAPASQAHRESAEEAKERLREAMLKAGEAKRRERLESMPPEQRAFWEQFDSVASAEEKQKALQDWHVRQTTTRLNKELAVSPEEWTVIEARIVAVLVLFSATTGQGTSPVALRVAQGRGELTAALQNKESKPEEIKAKLTALRAAKEQARRELAKAQQDLRKLMTLRQEAALVLNGLLD